MWCTCNHLEAAHWMGTGMCFLCRCEEFIRDTRPINRPEPVRANTVEDEKGCLFVVGLVSALMLVISGAIVVAMSLRYGDPGGQIFIGIILTIVGILLLIPTLRIKI